MDKVRSGFTDRNRVSLLFFVVYGLTTQDSNVDKQIRSTLIGVRSYFVKICAVVMCTALKIASFGIICLLILDNVKLSITKNMSKYVPHGPLVNCSFLPLEFLDCEEPLDHKGNKTAQERSDGLGCLKFGGSRYEEVEKAKVLCQVLPEIECYGDRHFIRGGFPCVKYSSHYFTTTLIYSILLGFLGMDRFCLGQTGTAVGKLLTLGGVGIWWLVDIVLLVTNGLQPEDGSNWSNRA